MFAVWHGILFGLLLAILIGPVFFALIQTSIQRGFLAGVFMGLGIALSDSFYIFITYLGVSHILNNPSVHFWLGLGGGFIMVGFGLFSILKPVPDFTMDKPAPLKKRSLLNQTLKGFLLNGINPSVLLFWIGIASFVTVNYKFTSKEFIVFFATIIITVFCTDILKSFVANKLRIMLSHRFLTLMNKVVGVGLILFGLRLFYYALEAGNYAIF